MKIPEEVVGTVGKCIYCFAEKGLETEHIIAFALNGYKVLLEASCRKCATITGRFEQEILRGFLRATRAALGFQTRKPKERPKRFSLETKKNGRTQMKDVPVEDNLNIIPLPFFELPEYLMGREHKDGIGWTGMQVIHIGKTPQDLIKGHDVDNVAISGWYSPVAFARMIAKIAYATVVSEMGLESIAQSYVAPAIIDHPMDIGRWVGSFDKVFPPVKEGSQHRVRWQVVNGEVIANVRLFACYDTIEYVVVVGRVTEERIRFAEMRRVLLQSVGR